MQKPLTVELFISLSVGMFWVVELWYVVTVVGMATKKNRKQLLS